MSEFKFSCPSCGQHIQCDEQLCGREIECPNCRLFLTVPATPENALRPAQPPLAAQSLAPRDDRRDLRAGWKVAPALSAGLAVVLTGIMLVWSVRGLWRLQSRETAVRQEQDDIKARQHALWLEHLKQGAQEQARFKQQQELWLQREQERIRKQQEQRQQRNDRQRQLAGEDSQLLARLSRLPLSSSEYRTVYNRLQVVRAELNAIEKQDQADLRELLLSADEVELDWKLRTMPRLSPERPAISNQLQTLRAELLKLRGRAAEPSLAEMVASNANSLSSNFSRQMDALDAARAKLDPADPARPSPRVRARWYTATTTTGAAFVVSLLCLIGALRSFQGGKSSAVGLGGEGLANEDYPMTQGGLVKLDPDTTLENLLIGGAIGTLVFALGAAKTALAGHRHSPPNPELLPLALCALPFAVAFFIAYWLTDNYYLLDRERHQVFYHFKFLWFRRLRLFLQRKDVVAVAVQGRKQGQRRQPTTWEYRIGVVGATGRWIALSEWQSKSLDDSNREAENLATMLGCKAYPAPPSCELAVRRYEGGVTIAYLPLWHGLTRKERWLCVFVGVAVLGAILGGILVYRITQP